MLNVVACPNKLAMDDHKITGGCISIWRRKSLNQDEVYLLSRYAKYLNFLSHSFTIRIRPINSINIFEKIQILLSIGYLPIEEILICGFSDVIFLSAEAILKDSGGFLSLGVGATKEEFATLKGIVKKIHKIEFDNYYPYFESRTYNLIDWEFTSNYFNRFHDDETKEMYSINRFRKLETDYPNASYGEG